MKYLKSTDKHALEIGCFSEDLLGSPCQQIRRDG